MNLFFTGGTGFFGKALLKHWLKNGHVFSKITILSRDPETFIKANKALVNELPLDFVQGSVEELDQIKTKNKVNFVLHAATDSTAGPNMEPLAIYDQITKGSENVFAFCGRHNVSKVLFTSTGGVYGQQPENMATIPESYNGMPCPTMPQSAHGIAKRSAEHMGFLYAEKFNFDYVVTRCFAFIGEDLPLNGHFAVGNFLSDALQKRDIVIKSDGMQVRSYMYQDDLAFVLNALLVSRTNSNVYNVGSTERISIKKLATMIRDLLAPEVKVKIIGAPTDNPKNVYVPDIRLLKSELPNFRPMSLENAILTTSSKLTGNYT